MVLVYTEKLTMLGKTPAGSVWEQLSQRTRLRTSALSSHLCSTSMNHHTATLEHEQTPRLLVQLWAAGPKHAASFVGICSKPLSLSGCCHPICVCFN